MKSEKGCEFRILFYWVKLLSESDADAVSTPDTAAATDTDSNTPVSYTHLDVYKRQLFDTGDKKRITIQYFFQTKASFTLTDNVMRVGRRGDITQNIADSADPVSYTHLDVYKRQARCSGRRDGWYRQVRLP